MSKRGERREERGERREERYERCEREGRGFDKNRFPHPVNLREEEADVWRSQSLGHELHRTAVGRVSVAGDGPLLHPHAQRRKGGYLPTSHPLPVKIPEPIKPASMQPLGGGGDPQEEDEDGVDNAAEVHALRPVREYVEKKACGQQYQREIGRRLRRTRRMTKYRKENLLQLMVVMMMMMNDGDDDDDDDDDDDYDDEHWKLEGFGKHHRRRNRSATAAQRVL